MIDYKTEEVQEYLNIYGRMVFLWTEYSAGVHCQEHREYVQKAIDKAKTKFPKEFKDECFNDILAGLERIVKGEHKDELYNIAIKQDCN